MRFLLATVLAFSTTPPLAKLILQPSQVGTGYMLLQRTDGSGVGTLTLDLCGRKNYPSESLRLARLQVNYLKSRTAPGLSNEVVAYRHGGAAQAMREVTHHAVTCPRTPIDTGEPGLPPLRFTITRIPDSLLAKDHLAVRIRVRGTINGVKVDKTSYAIYQRIGDVLSGTYSFGPNTPAQRAFALHAAEQSARNLRLGHSVGVPTA